MSRTGSNVASSVALVLQNKMAGATYMYKRSQGRMFHVVLTSLEIHLKYISSHWLGVSSVQGKTVPEVLSMARGIRQLRGLY